MCYHMYISSWISAYLASHLAAAVLKPSSRVICSTRSTEFLLWNL